MAPLLVMLHLFWLLISICPVLFADVDGIAGDGDGDDDDATADDDDDGQLGL